PLAPFERGFSLKYVQRFTNLLNVGRPLIDFAKTIEKVLTTDLAKNLISIMMCTFSHFFLSIHKNGYFCTLVTPELFQSFLKSKLILPQPSLIDHNQCFSHR
uniref:Uncharacterized protein n=1 Tax=Romanomermis culicivorax TaxID=13658 RepID=A0A915L4P0_ROMCU